MHDKKFLLLSQAIITLLMATLMSAIMLLINLGPTAEWLAHWPTAALTAWPIAFILTQFVGPLEFRLAAFALRRNR